MTLILSCATHDYLVQVSDRRLTYINTGEIADDNANKIVLFCHRMAFAYTGIATIDTLRTDEWLSNVLSTYDGTSLSDACSGIVSSATDTFKSISLNNKKKCHAFVGVGWTLISSDNKIRPIICTISNAQNEQGEWFPHSEEEFKLRYSILTDSELFQFESTGQRVDQQTFDDLKLQIKKCVIKNTGPEPITRILIGGIRKVATTNHTVGQNLLAVSLPKSALRTKNIMFLSSHPNKDEMTFLYYPDGKNDGVQYGPNFACKGWGVTNFKVTPHT